MHRNPHRRDAMATKAAGFASRYSYVSHRIHPGTNHQCVYLAGFEDCGSRRAEVFTRDRWKCVDCGCYVQSWGGNGRVAHLAHGGHTKVERCWCMENLKTKCEDCHGRNDHHGRFGASRKVTP